MFFALAIAFNINVFSSGSEKDVSLEGIAVMAKANKATELMDGSDPVDSPGGSGCEMNTTCAGGVCVVINGKKRFLANGCKLVCGYTCTVQSWPSPF
jgi:hypothetical protein